VESSLPKLLLVVKSFVIHLVSLPTYINFAHLVFLVGSCFFLLSQISFRIEVSYLLFWIISFTVFNSFCFFA
jgi:hypothetical protein